MRSRRIFSVVALLGCLGLVSPGSAESVRAATKPDHIRVVANLDYPPYLYVDATGKPKGYEVDRWRLFEAHTGIKVELLPMRWDDAQQALLSGRADVIDLIYRTPALEARYEFSPPYRTVPIAVFVDHRIRGVRDAASLQGFGVGVVRGDACMAWLQDSSASRLDVFDSYERMAKAVSTSRPHIFCMPEDVAAYYLHANGALDRFDKAFTIQVASVHLATRKGSSALLQTVEDGMARITPAERASLEREWLEHDFTSRSNSKLIRAVAVVFIVTIVLMAAWLWALRRSLAIHSRKLTIEEGKLRTLIDSSPDAVWVVDRSDVYSECNASALRLFRSSRCDVIGHADEQLFGSAFAARTRAMNEEVRRLGQPRTFSIVLPLAGGEPRHLEVIKAPLCDRGGTTGDVLCVARDITERLKLEAQLRLWAHAFRYASFGLVIFDPSTQGIVAVNPAFARERGYMPEEMAGMPADKLYPPHLLHEWAGKRELINRQSHTLIESEHIARDGRCFPVLLDISVTHAADGRAEQVVAYVQDISERKRIERELRLSAIAFQSQAALILAESHGVIERVNDAFCQLTGYATEEVAGKSVSLLGEGLDEATRLAAHDGTLQGGPWRGDIWLHCKRGQPKVVRAVISTVCEEDGTPFKYLYSVVDVSAEHAARTNVEHLTFFDPLTDLPNRYFLRGRLQQSIDGATAGYGVLLMLDMDRFKRINDLYSHQAGDKLLVLIAQRLRELLGEDCLLCRLGGAAFAALVDGKAHSRVPGCELAAKWTCRIQSALAGAFEMRDSTYVTMTASIGWTEWTHGSGSPETLLKEAEIAMYRAKEDGRDRACRFEPSLAAAVEYREAIINDLEKDIARGNLDLHFQALVDREGHVTGAEALLRWARASGDRVSPDVFVPMAEHVGLIAPLGRWVLERACVQLAAWAGQPATRDLSLAVNVSAKQFADPGFVDSVCQALAAAGADSSRLKLEITETAILHDVHDVTRKLSRLRALGIRTSLDDFGTGYSSLAYLSDLPLDQLKIDRSFVKRLPGLRRDEIVIRAIIGMSHGLGLEVVAEGIETEVQRNFLMSLGCDQFQGYLFAKPMPASEFSAMLQAHLSPELV